MYIKSLALAAALTGCVIANTDDDKVYKYVVTFSIDGMHGSDVEKYIALRPGSTIASLVSTAYEYTDCYTSAPSDSYPGVANFVTGASPRTTGNCARSRNFLHMLIILGIWYDDVYDRSFWSPYSTTGTNCSGPPGAEGRIA
jgi:hypothetical protein